MKLLANIWLECFRSRWKRTSDDDDGAPFTDGRNDYILPRRLRCQSEHADSGTIVLTDAPADNHGRGENFSPSDLLAVSLGSCILSVMAIAARAMKVEIIGATATVTKDMSNAPRRIARIAVTLRVPGIFSTAQRAALTAAAHACPVHHALAIDAPIHIVWED